MGTESIEASFLSIFALISFFIFLIVSKYSHKIKDGILLDKDFLKPQAFHESSNHSKWRISCNYFFEYFFCIFITFCILKFYMIIFLSAILCFLVGFLDDLKIRH